MIGVIASPADEPAVREFFELFKTPWELFRRERSYDVVISTGTRRIDDIRTKLLLVYAGEKTAFDVRHEVRIQSRLHGSILSFLGNSFPIYGKTVTFKNGRPGILTDESSGESVIHVGQSGEKTIVRVGYDLFGEIEASLVGGQPLPNAGVPTLELHIAVLRNLMLGCGIPVVEIPPVPADHEFLACLTHDVDHASIRKYRFDATMFGFLYRATLGSAVKLAHGRLSVSNLLTNWLAAAKLPLVHLGLAKDFWYDFDRYLQIESGRPSTFFVVPFAGRPGRSSNGSAPPARGTGYCASEITGKIQQLKTAGCEIGLHGIDAWLESDSGREEAQRIAEISRTSSLGVRMHWLYSDQNSPSVLEEAGFFYDSTVGYNETVGYRAGTAQVFKPLRASRLLELPLLVMDTALFYPTRLNLSETDAWDRITPLFENASRFGGTVTINWHERSIAPERLWGDFYTRVLGDLTERGAWFCTAAQAVSWFQKRRSVVFEMSDSHQTMRANVTQEEPESLPGLRLRCHKPRTLQQLQATSNGIQEDYTDTSFTGSSISLS